MGALFAELPKTDVGEGAPNGLPPNPGEDPKAGAAPNPAAGGPVGELKVGAAPKAEGPPAAAGDCATPNPCDATVPELALNEPNPLPAAGLDSAKGVAGLAPKMD